MNILRIIATILVLAPIPGLAGTVYGMVGAFNELAESGAQPKPEELSVHIQIALITTFFGILLFLIGVFLHVIFAKMTGVYSRTTWNIMLVMSILLVPILIGIVFIILSFTMPTLKKMRLGVDDARGAAQSR